MVRLPQNSQRADNFIYWEYSEEESYFVFGSFMTLLGFIFSILSMLSCSFAIVNWAVDGVKYALGIGLFRWYNTITSSCRAYNQDSIDSIEFVFADRAAKGLSAAAVAFGGLWALIVLVIIIASLGCCVKRGCCPRFNLNSTSHATFFVLSGLTFSSSILQICTLTYFKNDVCNTEGLNCTMGLGAHYAIASFFLYLIGCFVYVYMARARLRLAKAGRGVSEQIRGVLEESLLGIGPV